MSTIKISYGSGTATTSASTGALTLSLTARQADEKTRDANPAFAARSSKNRRPLREERRASTEVLVVATMR
jgi:hypothetical protein